MKIRYRIHGFNGDRELGAADLAAPFMLGPGRPHPRVSVGDFFEAVKDFVTADYVLREPLSPAFKREMLPALRGEGEGSIRMEKHGAFYHIACFEWAYQGSDRRFAVVSALEEAGKRFLAEDVRNIGRLLKERGGDDLPALYCMAEVRPPAGLDRPGWTMVLAEWLDGCHEWHHTVEEEASRILIWERIGARRYADEAEYTAIYRGIARLLTLRYNPVTFERIDLWHHAAGDFIVCGTGDELRVKLTTVRRYAPMPFFVGERGIDPRIPLVYFFLESALKTRCDRCDGVGELVWANDDALGPALDGFCQGLEEWNPDRAGVPLGSADVMGLLEQFSADEFHEIYDSLLPLHEGGDPEELELMQTRLPQHCAALVKSIQNASARSRPAVGQERPATK